MCRWTRDDDERLSRSATGSPRLIGTRYRPGSSDLTTSISSSSLISRGALILAEIQTLMKILALLVSSPSCFVFRQNPRWTMKDRSFFSRAVFTWLWLNGHAFIMIGIHLFLFVDLFRWCRLNKDIGDREGETELTESYTSLRKFRNSSSSWSSSFNCMII